MEKFGVTAYNINVKQSEVKKSDEKKKEEESASLDDLAAQTTKILRERKSRGNK